MDVFEQFLRESHKIFSKELENPCGLIALWQIQNEVISQKISAEDALRELASPPIVSMRLTQAFKTYDGLLGDNITLKKLNQLVDEAEKKAIIDKAAHDDLVDISDKISSIKETVLLIDQKMDQAKKRTAKNFKIGLTISLSSLAIGVSGLAAKYGWFEGHNEVATAPHNRKRFASAHIIEADKTTEILHPTANVNAQAYDAEGHDDVVRLSLSPWGPLDPNSGRKMMDLMLDRRIVNLPLKDRLVSLCLEPTAPFLCKQPVSAPIYAQ